ncbi:MAG: S8 family peptidase [Acidimicrobiales bacterium]
MQPDKVVGEPADSAHVVWRGIEKKRGVAWRATAGDRYLYRPGQLLVDRSYEDRLRLDRFDGEPVKLRHKEGRLLEQLGVRLWTIGRGTAPEVVDELRKGLDVPPEDQERAVTLNNVLAVAQVMRFGPGDLPKPSDDSPVEPEPSRGVGAGTGKGVRVSILDTGFVKASTLHPLLAKDYADDGNDRDAFYDEASRKITSVFGGHGTFIAGIIRQHAPDAVLDPEVTLDNVGLVDDLELALDLLSVRRADIINLSLAGPSKGDVPPPALATVLAYLRDHSEAVVVAAAGNDFEMASKANRPHTKMWPAAFGEMPGHEHVVGVAAVDRSEAATDFSNRGPWVRACAYGQDERSTYLQGDMAPPVGTHFDHPTATWSGTSFAAPRVVGAIAARMTSCDGAMSARDALEKILDESPDGPDFMGKFVA